MKKVLHNCAKNKQKICTRTLNIKTGNRPRYDTNRENNYKQQITTTTTTTTGQMYDMTRILFHTTTTRTTT